MTLDGPRIASLLALAAACAGSLGCASLTAPFGDMKTSQMTVYRLQNYEPPQQAQAAAAPQGVQLPPQIQQWVQAGASLLPRGLLPPGLLPGSAPATPPPADAPRFHGFRIIEWQAVNDPAVKIDIVDTLGHSSSFTAPQFTCMYAELGFAIAQPSGPTPADVLVSLSCQGVQAYNFTGPTGIRASRPTPRRSSPRSSSECSPAVDGGRAAAMDDRPLVSYDPNAVLAWFYKRFFESIEVDESWARAVREADARGTVVYVLRNLSLVDFLALDYLTKRHRLPQIRFANDLGLSLLEPMNHGWLSALRPRTHDGDAADLERAVLGGSSAALFLKRPPHLLEGKARGKVEGDHLIRALFDVQRRSATRILFVPQVFLWSRSPGMRGGTLADTLFGTSEWPGNLRSIGQFLVNRRHATMRAGEPVDLHEFLAREQDGVGDDVLLRRLTYTLLRRLERERRAMVGPTRKPPDRLRDEVIRSPKLQKVIADMAGEGEKERAVIRARALRMLTEMEAALDMSAMGALDRVFAQVASRMFSAIEVDEAGVERLREHAKEGTLVYLPSYKSQAIRN